MITLLSKWFIKDRGNYAAPAVRLAYGMLCGLVGIGWNVLLFAAKLFAGLLSGSIAVMADAFNNLADAGSSVITFIGFRMAGKKPDPDHPFGHGRIEYIAGLIVSLAIILMGFELAKTSIDKILHPSPVEFSVVALLILVASVAVKLYMVCYNRAIGKKIGSTAMRATAIDSLSDCCATTVVLIAMLVGEWTGLNIDGYCGVAVAGFILYAGLNAAKETVGPLLGQPPAREFVEEIERIVMAHEDVQGIHDLVVHDYGPGRCMLSVHAEVPAKNDVLQMHDLIDNIEQELRDQLGCEAVIHMDPIVTDDPLVDALKQRVAVAVTAIDPALSFHDFRIVPGPTHTNLIFDVVTPYNFRLSDEQVKTALIDAVRAFEDGKYFAVIQIDKQFT